MEIFKQFLLVWASMYALSLGVYLFSQYLARKNARIRMIVSYIFLISTSIHEWSHHLMAKLTGAESKLEYINLKEGSYTYTEKDRTLMKSILVSFAPSLLGTLFIVEILRYIRIAESMPFWVYCLLNVLIIFIFLSMPSSSADIFLILKTFSENPINLATTIAKSTISFVLIIIFGDQIRGFIPVRSPYFEILLFGVLYYAIRLVSLVIPSKVIAYSKSKNEKRLNASGPAIYCKKRIDNPEYNLQEQKRTDEDIVNQIAMIENTAMYDTDFYDLPLELFKKVNNEYQKLMPVLSLKDQDDIAYFNEFKQLTNESQIKSVKMQRLANYLHQSGNRIIHQQKQRQRQTKTKTRQNKNDAELQSYRKVRTYHSGNETYH